MYLYYVRFVTILHIVLIVKKKELAGNHAHGLVLYRPNQEVKIKRTRTTVYTRFADFQFEIAIRTTSFIKSKSVRLLCKLR
jgi:hypothetical protein